MINSKVPLLLAIFIYIFFYWVRWEQGGWELKTHLLKGLRDNLDSKIAEILPSPQAQLLSGIVLGQNKELPGQLRLALRDTSTLHIVVASGQNLSMVAGFFLFFSGLIKRKTALILSFLSIVFYTLLTGAEVPILRAAIMVSAGFLAQALGREKDSIWIVIGVGALMLLINPVWITSLSFQLSFLATLGVVGVSPMLMSKFAKIPKFIRGDLSVSLAAQVLVLPVIAQNFHQISLVALPANLLVLWTIPFIMIGGAILLVLTFISPTLAVIMGFLLNIILTYFIYIVNFFAGFNWAWVYIGEQVWLVWIGYYLLVAGVLKFIYDLKGR
ncbi:hypothetical protein A2769_04035 [Candidatus Daviesbacteria bacterium RIFCSPHIGHO2_01_FULL_37_27]|nr:MAG: hypothetical protein A2769_04035 [Candidatus Daviesbacteria bacterium RIFCSPHIGHO2_01_FULL_37_27]OGE46162.1 MAG: hypothetical protein A3B39_02080 [Candidatus Daviesbacteria bacterium RIFCSPLOWO2_01_FULL_37_10]